MRMSPASPHVDASVYYRLPHDVPCIVRKFTPHPVAVLLDDAFRAFFTKREQRVRPIAPPRLFNTLAFLDECNRMAVLPAAKRPDAGVCSELARKFTPHPVFLLVENAHQLWYELKDARRFWPRDEQPRVERAQRVRNHNVEVALFNCLQDRDNDDAWDRSGVTSGLIMSDYEDDPWDYEPYYAWPSW